MPLQNWHMQLFPRDTGTASWVCNTPNAQWVLCTCEKLEVLGLPGHARGWQQDAG